MTEQQQHLSNLLQQRETLRAELEKLQVASGNRKELYFKVEGAIEYLTQIGVTLPEEDASETEEDVSETEVES